MATASRHLCRSLVRMSSRPPSKRKCIQVQRRYIQPSPFRQLSTFPARFAKQEPISSDPDFNDEDLQSPQVPYTVDDLDPEERADYETMSKKDQARYLAVQNHIKAVMESGEMADITEDMAKRVAFQVDREGTNPNFLEERDLQKMKDDYWQEDEDDEFGQVPDADDEVDDSYITSIAESELEVHREVREYQRIAAWDLPLLSQFTKAYQPPQYAKEPLRFRYTTYLGESHPAAKKVVVEFKTEHIAQAANLSEDQRTKLIKLVGVRYNPDTDLVHMSSEKFENPAQNKRYLGDLVNKIVAEAKDKKDTFKDIPLDFRHHKPRVVYKFPDAWKMKEDRSVQSLLKRRDEVKLLEEEEKIVDGKQVVEMYVRAKGMAPGMARPM
ncbi:37S ribosomal protein S24, mitochondrial [Neophaeococcomyces mojaviensis]|uniref:37S ribosomal protein S24, mitochondrial n=1 Tax=Neophaeococcomyces mojaviensis TaxID=3383035 RepID=A0ACC3A6E9_9EURO|nr:37S ribosomal protein S24, mitochondrial [Knufia sp. JES_112]